MTSRWASNEAVLEQRIAELNARISSVRDVLCRLYLIQQRVSLEEDLRNLYHAKCTMVGADNSGGGAKGDVMRRDAHFRASQAIGLP